MMYIDGYFICDDSACRSDTCPEHSYTQEEQKDYLPDFQLLVKLALCPAARWDYEYVCMEAPEWEQPYENILFKYRIDYPDKIEFNPFVDECDCYTVRS